MTVEACCFQTWMWLVGPLVLYAVERSIRLVRSLQPVVITKVTYLVYVAFVIKVSFLHHVVLFIYPVNFVLAFQVLVNAA